MQRRSVCWENCFSSQFSLLKLTVCLFCVKANQFWGEKIVTSNVVTSKQENGDISEMLKGITEKIKKLGYFITLHCNENNQFCHFWCLSFLEINSAWDDRNIEEYRFILYSAIQLWIFKVKFDVTVHDVPVFDVTPFYIIC